MAKEKRDFNVKQLLNRASLEAAGPATVDETPRRAVLKVIPLSVYDLVPSDDNFYSVDDITDLKMSIEMHGVKQCLTVKPLGDGKYKVLAGHRRRLACLALVEEGKDDFEFVPCGLETGTDDTTDKILTITTNSTARQLSDWEKVKQAEVLRRYYEELKKRDNLPGRVRDMVTEALKTSGTQVARMDAISNNLSDDFMQALKDGKLGISAAYELSGLTEEAQREALKKYTTRGGLSLNDIRALRGEEKEPTAPSVTPENEIMDGQIDIYKEESATSCLPSGFIHNTPAEPVPESNDYMPGNSGEHYEPTESGEEDIPTAPKKEEKRDFADLTQAEKADSAIELLNYYRFTIFQPGTDTRIYDFIIDTLEKHGKA